MLYSLRSMRVTGRNGLIAALGISLTLLTSTMAGAEDKPTDAAEGSKPETQALSPATVAAGEGSDSRSSGGESKPADKPKYPPFADVMKDAKPTADPSLIKLYQKDGKLLAELKSNHFDRDFIVLISIAKGIGEGDLLGGMSWGFGDDWVWQFRKVEDNVHVVRRNVRFRADKGSPEERAVSLAYTDSVLFSLPTVTTSPSGGTVVDLTPIFMSDLPQISRSLPGFGFAQNKSTWAAVKGFEKNVEIEVAATYASGGSANFDTVPDSRGVTINVHYSISLLPQNSYKPRLADDRVGYFLTVLKDYSKKGNDDRFVRYINRWDLQKADPSADMSPPKEPIIFYLEKTIPFKYRKPIKDGITEWNKAFAKAGFIDAIEVRQQEQGDTWDPEDINYNTFRWITSSAGFAMGPSRVNPTNGQILDADIIFDADFIQFWKQEYETFTAETISRMTGGALDLQTYQEEQAKLPEHLRHSGHAHRCELHDGFSKELALGSAVATLRAAAKSDPAAEEKMLMQGLKEVTMHEVGHTLGLRHNFKSSTIYTLEELNDTEKTKETGLTGSVMDYSPANIMPEGVKQGDYFSTTIGPYDMWAIEYGYKPLSGSTESEVEELKKIASRAAEPQLAYATDEDTRGIDPDPLSNRFDMGKDPVEYAKLRAKLIAELWPDVVNDVTKDGEGYQKARQAFGILLGNHGRAMHFASRYVGGLYVNRDHKGDANARPPFQVVEVAKQRDALALVEEQVFSDKPFNFPPELYNYMAASRWNHWGMNSPIRLDLPAHEVISMWQERILSQLMSSLTLERLHDSELKVPADQDALTTAELIERLTAAIFAEVNSTPSGEFTNRKPAVSSLRRNLQRIYLKRLSDLAMGNSYAPQDCQTVAYLQLEELKGKLDAVLAADVKLDTYSKAHLKESAQRIGKVLDAQLQLSRP
ncbi:MAG: zinc-dependent metalloprotease [Pirellulales bacterium]|nr:zinc-dependent metalloprotease [Pirellulales bacterium]